MKQNKNAGGYKDLPADSLGDEKSATGRPKMNEAKLNSAEWKNLFFVVRGDLPDNDDSFSKVNENEDIYPVEFRGEHIMKCII